MIQQMPAHNSKQSGFILISVVLAITLTAAIAYLMNYEGAMNVNSLGREIDATGARYAAKSGFNVMLWQANRADCAGYANITDAAIGAASYSATITPTSGSPVSITATGTQAGGASYSLQRDRVKVFHPPITVVLQLGTTPGMDASINSFSSTSNYGDGDEAILNALITYKNQLIQFDLSSIPPEITIVSAQLQLYQISGAGTANIDLYRVSNSWIEGTKSGSGPADGATWKTTDGTHAWLTNGGDYDATKIASTSVTGGGNVTSTWEVAALVQNWVDGKYPNYGMLLKSAGLASFTFASKEDTTAENRPKLVVTYYCECGKVCTGAPPPAKKVYWTDDVANKIQRSDEDGNNVEDVITGLDRPRGLDIDAVNGKLYWTNGRQIKRSDLNGNNVETIFSGSVTALDIKLDVAGGKMYWTHDDGYSLVKRANLDGSNSDTINTSLNRPAYITLDAAAGFLYLTEFGDGSVSRMNLDGTGITALTSGPAGAVGNAVDLINGKLYWTGGATNDWIRRSNIDGSIVETIVTGLNAPQDIVYDSDNDRIYWVDALNRLLQRSDPDGSNIETLVTGLSRPRAIALVNADLIPPIVGGGCNGAFRDEFNIQSYGNNDGTLTWTGDWQEINESDGPARGDEVIQSDPLTSVPQPSNQIRVRDNDGGGEGVMRSADLTGAGSATLSFDYRRENLSSTSHYVSIQIASAATGGFWVEIGKLQGPTPNDAGYIPASYDITAYAANDTTLRIISASTMGNFAGVWFDNIEIQCSP